MEQRIGPEGGAWTLMADGARRRAPRAVPAAPAAPRPRGASRPGCAARGRHRAAPAARARLAALAVAGARGRGCSRSAWSRRRRRAARRGALAAANKVAHTECAQRIAEAGLALGGAEALAADAPVEFLWRQSLWETIGGGTSEVMRGVVARQALGLGGTEVGAGAALVFEHRMPRLVATKLLAALTPRAYVGPTAPIRHARAARARAPGGRLAACSARGSAGSAAATRSRCSSTAPLDNPMTALISFPQVLGHEVVGVVERVGPAVKTRRRRRARGAEPVALLRAARASALRVLRARRLRAVPELHAGRRSRPGIHHGNSASRDRAASPRGSSAHESQCIPVPEASSDEAAVLADPFSVSLHAVLREPPPAGRDAPSSTAAARSACSAVAILRALHPACACSRWRASRIRRRSRAQLGAERVLAHRPLRGLLEALGEATGAALQEPWRGLPMLNGGVDVIYDSVASAETLEVGLRAAAPRARIVLTGVATPRRFEWTPLYFKEVAMVGLERLRDRELRRRAPARDGVVLRAHAPARGLDVDAARHPPLPPRALARGVPGLPRPGRGAAR